MEAFVPAPAVTTNHHQQHKEEGFFAVVDDSSTIADFFCRPTLNYYAAASARRAEYRWCGVEQVDQAAPLAGRSNGWRSSSQPRVVWALWKELSACPL